MIGLHMKCLTCNTPLEIPESFFEGGASPFWKQHGHFPVKVLLIAGEDMIAFGPEVEEDPSVSLEATLNFYLQHKTCSCPENQYSESCGDHGTDPKLYH